jgi:hypothetical protein
MAQAFKAGFDAVRAKLRSLQSAFLDDERVEQLRQEVEAAARVHARMQAGLAWQVTEALQGLLAATLEAEEARATVAQLEELVKALQAQLQKAARGPATAAPQGDEEAEADRIKQLLEPSGQALALSPRPSEGQVRHLAVAL